MDDNPATMADPTWLPQSLKTAADPSYPGAHATISAGGAFVLRKLFGNMPLPVNVTSEVLPEVVRPFDGFATTNAIHHRCAAAQLQLTMLIFVGGFPSRRRTARR